MRPGSAGTWREKGPVIGMPIKKAAIVGRGAVGLLYGSLIAANIGPEAVMFAMDDERFERHRGERVTVNGEPLAVRTVPMSEAEPVDLVIIAVKARGLASAIESITPLVGPETCIASLLNGITSEEDIARRYGWERTVLGICQGMDAVFLEGALTYTHPGEIRFGAAEGTLPGVVEDIADFYARAGIAHVVEADPRRRMWAKLMMNVGINQTCMVFGGTYGSASEPGEQNRCMVAAMRETLAVARAEGVALTEGDLAEMASIIASIDPEGMPSMAQDRIAKRPTEVDLFAGTVIRLAERHGILVPQNRWLLRRVREIESSW